MLNIVSTLDVGAGTLTMAAGSSFGAGTGTLQVDGTLTTLESLSFAGTLTDNGTVNVEGTGKTLTLSGATDTINGVLNIVSTLDVGAGTLTMAAGSSFGAGTGTLQVDGTLTTLESLSFAGTLTDNGTVNVEGTGKTLTLSGATDTINGVLNIVSTLDVGAGTLTMAAGSGFGAGTGTLQVDGTLTTLESLSFAGTLTDNGTVNVEGAGKS